MSQILVEKNPNQATLDSLGVSKWPTWKKEVSTFPWEFLEQEIAYILEGECVITPTGGAPVTFGKGDLGHDSKLGSETTTAQALQTRWQFAQSNISSYQGKA
jgi:ethanolamine utilization protein EutQ (cupin superfamily)